MRAYSIPSHDVTPNATVQNPTSARPRSRSPPASRAASAITANQTTTVAMRGASNELDNQNAGTIHNRPGPV